METGEFDYAWNMQLAPDVLAAMAEGGVGTPISAFGTLVERIEMNLTNPSPDLPEGERATVAHPHPFLSDFAVRHALSMAIDRSLLVEVGYGQAGRPTCNLVPGPEIYASTDNTGCLTQDLEGAKALLDEAGWVDSNGDGIRDKDGVELKILFQTSTNAVRQDFQALIKDMWSQIGVETELRNLDASVFLVVTQVRLTRSRSSTQTWKCMPTTSTARTRKPTSQLTVVVASLSLTASGRVRTSTVSAIQLMTR